MHETIIKNPQFIFRLYIEKKGKAVLEIENNGPAIAKEIQKRIFEPFYTTKPVGIGTGLGLSISYFIIVENHKGEIEVESEKTGGVKFIIRLPL
jgi:signal transduction histidine kinase